MEESTSNYSPPLTNPEALTTPRRLRPWFVAGFFLTIIGLLVGLKGYVLLPSGVGVARVPLWRYYIIEVSRAISGPHNLGPGSGGSSALIEHAIVHLLIAIAGGLLTLGLGWVIRRFSHR